MKFRHYLVIVAVGGLYLLSFRPAAAARQTRELESELKKTFDLSPGYKKGDKDFYRMKTIYLDFGDSGEVSETTLLDGYFSREVVRLEDGKRTDRVFWKGVKRGTGKGRAEVDARSALPFTQNFEYSFTEGEWTPKHFPVDLSRLPRTMDGWIFFVKLMDAHTFDVLHNTYAPPKPPVRIGETIVPPVEGLPVGMDFPPLFTDSRFVNGPARVTFQGLTLYRNEPCAVVVFRCDDSRVHFTVNVNNMKLPTDGVSYYGGTMFISVRSRKIVWAELLERVDMITAVAPTGQSMKMRKDREITLEKIAPSDFEKVD